MEQCLSTLAVWNTANLKTANWCLFHRRLFVGCLRLVYICADGVCRACINVRRQHYVSFPFGVDVLLGMNGFIWITRTTTSISCWLFSWLMMFWCRNNSGRVEDPGRCRWGCATGRDHARVAEATHWIGVCVCLLWDQLFTRSVCVEELSVEDRLKVARVRNAIYVLR